MKERGSPGARVPVGQGRLPAARAGELAGNPAEITGAQRVDDNADRVRCPREGHHPRARPELDLQIVDVDPSCLRGLGSSVDMYLVCRTDFGARERNSISRRRAPTGS